MGVGQILRLSKGEYRLPNFIMAFEAKNVLNKHFVFKFVEFVFVFIVFMIFRVGNDGDIFYWGLGPSPPTTTTTTTTITTTTTAAIATGKAQTGFERNIFLDKLLHSKAAEDKESFKSSDCVLNERDENDLVFGIMTTLGYWFITIVLMIGLLLGDRPKMMILLFNIFGFLFFLSIGSEQIARYRGREGKHTANGMGAMAILTSIVYLVDSVFSFLDLKSGE